MNPDERVASLRDQTGYQSIRGTKPQTRRFALAGTPAGLTVWIIKKFRASSDCGGDVETAFTRDRLVARINFCCFARAIGSSFWPYSAMRLRPRAIPDGRTSHVPAGYAYFPAGILRPSCSLAEPASADLRSWSVIRRGPIRCARAARPVRQRGAEVLPALAPMTAALIIGAVSVAIWVYLLCFRGGFWWLPYRHPPLGASAAARSVVAVIPARDEAAVIGRAVASLLQQDYCGGLHLVVIDDLSTDGTSKVARVAANVVGAADRLTICRGKPVPPGWTGKLWAMRQGVELARSRSPDYLLLTDADIVHAADSVRELVARSEAEGYDLASLMVRLNCRSFWEKLLIPAFVFFFFKLYPPRWVADPARRTSAAAGGCMLLRASALERVGGLDSIRSEIIDDCALARRVKSVGTVWLGPSACTRSIREYRSWRPLWDMIVRSAFAQLGYSGGMLLLTVLMLGLTYVAAPLLLLSAQPAAITCGAVSWLAMSIAFLPTLRAYAAPWPLAPLLPMIALFYLAATIASAVLFWRGRGGYWKGRFQAAAPDGM